MGNVNFGAAPSMWNTSFMLEFHNKYQDCVHRTDSGKKQAESCVDAGNMLEIIARTHQESNFERKDIVHLVNGLKFAQLACENGQATACNLVGFSYHAEFLVPYQTSTREKAIQLYQRACNLDEGQCAQSYRLLADLLSGVSTGCVSKPPRQLIREYVADNGNDSEIDQRFLTNDSLPVRYNSTNLTSTISKLASSSSSTSPASQKSPTANPSQSSIAREKLLRDVQTKARQWFDIDNEQNDLSSDSSSSSYKVTSTDLQLAKHYYKLACQNFSCEYSCARAKELSTSPTS